MKGLYRPAESWEVIFSGIWRDCSQTEVHTAAEMLCPSYAVLGMQGEWRDPGDNFEHATFRTKIKVNAVFLWIKYFGIFFSAARISLVCKCV